MDQWAKAIQVTKYCLSGFFRRRLNRDSWQPGKDRLTRFATDQVRPFLRYGTRLRHETIPFALCSISRNQLPSFDIKVDVSRRS